MKLHLPSSLRRCLLATFAAAVATLGSIGAYAGTLHEDVSLQTYTDFGQNMGRYVTGGHVNALLSHIRAQEGITITYTGGEADYRLTPNTMADFYPQADNGASVAIGYNFIATVEHNGVQNPTFTSHTLPAGTSVQYNGVEYRDSDSFLLTPGYDYKITRLSKVVTDVNPAVLYTGTLNEGDLIYRAGSGNMTMRDKDGNIHSLRWPYDYITGGITEIKGVYEDGNRVVTNFDFSENGISDTAPLPMNGDSGDSGSPVFVWNESTQRYEYIGAMQSVNAINGAGVVTNSNCASAWSQTTMDAYSKQVDVQAAGNDVFVSGQMTQGESLTDNHGRTGEQWTGTVQDASGNTLTSYNGVKGGVNTWNSLSSLKDDDKWYAYGASYLNADENGTDGKMTMATLFRTENLVFTSGAAENSVRIDAGGVDLGVGYAQFSRTGNSSVSYTVSGGAFNHAGYIVDGGVSVHLASANTDAANMREWRKVGAGDLYIEGTGKNEVFLNLGGKGTTYLNEKGGYAAYNVLANTGTRVVLGDVNQIARDFTFGNGGAVLDFNGHSMTWNNEAGVNEEGFTIHALTEEAVITNGGNADVTLRVTNGGDAFLGSFRDTASADLNIVYAGAGNWNLHSIATDLTHGNSGFTVESGSVTLSGTQTVHGMGSVDGRSSARLERDNDWHYADAAMNVMVQGGTFVLGSHARLEGDVTVANGGTFVMNEAVQHQMEYVEGGSRLENTDKYAAFMGLKGNVTLNGGAMRVEFSKGTDATTTYNGKISGSGSLAIATGNGTIHLTGDNSAFSGTRTVENGTVSFADTKAMGDTSHTWLVQDKGVLVMPDSDDFSVIDTASTGVIALSRDTQTQALASLDIGAADGATVHYGAADTALQSADGKWVLGGGGGNLVVDFLLEGENQLVLGNGHSTGTVTLTNTNNSFSGGVVLNQGIRLECADNAALGGSKLRIDYGALADVHGDTSILDAASQGAALVDSSPRTDWNLTNTPNLSLAADGEVYFSGALRVADGADYRLGGASGTLTMATSLGGAHGLVVDGQGSTGGKVVLARTATLSGAVMVQGYDSDRASSGDIALSFTTSHALDAASSVTVRNNAVIDLNGTEQSFNQLSLDSTSAIIDSSARRTGTLSFASTTAAGLDGHVDVGALHLNNAALYTVSSSVAADTLVKEGSGTLQVADPTRFGSMQILGGTLQFSGGYNAEYKELIVRNATVHALNTRNQFMQLNGKLILGEGAVINSTHYAINGSVSVEDGATATISHPYSSSTADNMKLNATLTLGTGSTLKLAESTASTVLTNREVNAGGQGMIQLLNHALYLGDMKAKDTQRIGGELKISANSTLHSAGANAGVTRSFEHLSVDAGKTATLLTDADKVATTWQADKLTGEGSVVLDTHSGSKLVLTGESSVANISGNTAVELQGATVSSNLSGSLHLDSYGNSTLSGNNTYTGTTTVQNGTLTLMSEHALGGAAVSFTRGTLALGGNTSVTALQGPNGAVALNNHTLSLTGTNAANFAGALSGGNVTAVGTGQTLSGAVQVDSLSVAQGGALSITNGAELSSVTLAQDARLTLNGTVVLHGGIKGSTGSTLTLGSDIKVSLNFEDFTDGSFTIYSSTGNLAGTALTKDNILVDGLTGTQLGADRFTLQSLSNAVIVKVSDFSHELTWAGAQGLEEWNLSKSNWTNDKGESVVFRNGDRVTLGGSGSSIAVDSGIKAGSLTIAEGRHTLKTNTLQVSHDVIIESGSLDLSSDGDISVGGKVHIGTGAKLIYNYGSHTIDYGVEMENGASLEVNSGAKLDVRTDSHISDMTVSGTVSQNGKMYLDNLTVSNLDGLGVLTSAAMNINGVELEQARLASGGLTSLGKLTRTTLVLTSEGNAAVVSGTGGSQLTLYNAGSSMFAATNLTIKEDHALKLDLQTLKLNINGGSFVNRGELIVDTAATIAGGTFDTAGGTITANADLNLKSYSFTGNGNLNVLLAAAKSGEGTISINGNYGTASVLMGDADINAKLAVSNGLEVNSWMTDYKNSTLHIKERGQLTVTDKTLRVESSAIVSVEGGMLDAQAGITLGHTQATNPGHLAMESGSITTTGIELVNSGNSFTMSGGKLTVTGDKLFTGTGQASLAITGGTLAATRNSWALNHDVTLGDVSVETAAGKTISFTGQTILTTTLHNAGSISFAMEKVSGMEEVTKLLLAEGENWETSRTYRDRVSGSNENGFATTNYLLIAGSEGSTVNFNGRETISVNGSDYTLRTDGSSAWFTDGEQDTREYVVNSGTLHFGAADNAAEDGNHIRMNGGALSIEKNLEGRGVTIAANQAVNVGIAQGVAVQSAELYTEQGGSVSLSGAGLYELAEGATALNSNVSLAEDWSGTVAVSMDKNAESAVIGTNLSLKTTGENTLVKGTQSAVQLSGIHGYLVPGGGTFDANIVLENGHYDYAVQLDASSQNRKYDFTGKVSGSGDWRLGQGMEWGGNTYTFSGDVSGWEGSFISDANVSNTLAFSRENGVVNAAILQTGTGALNVTTAAETTFNADVTIGGVMTLGGLAHNNAAMNLTGGIAVSGNWVQFSTDYDAVSGDTQNGFSRGYLVLGGEGASIDLGSQNTVTVNGQSYDLHTGNGSAWVGGNDYTVNTRVEFGSDANDTLSATSLSLNNGAELVLAADLGERTVNVAANAATTVNIAENWQMKAASLTIGQGGSVALTGSGEYALSSGASALNSGVSLSDDWAGVVRISNYGHSGMNVSNAINTLGKEGTTVGLTGVNGWIAQNGTVSADLDLKDAGETAAYTISNGYKESLNHFSGTISGDGTLRHDWAPQYADNYSFDGDISSWTGVLENKKGMMGVVFTDNSSVVNAEIRTGAGADLALTTKGEHTTFNKTVNATSLSAEGNVTFNANATLGTLTENGHAVSLGKDTDLTLSQTIAGHATSGGNTDSAASVDLLVNGDAGSSLHLSMNTNTGWQQNNTIRVLSEDGKESVRDIYVSGAMAYDVFSGTAQTNLGSSNLHLADGSVLEIRKDQSENGINITSGDIVLTGTTEINLYGNASVDAKMGSAIRTEDKQKSTLKLTGGGGITLANSVEVGTLQVSANEGVGLTDTAAIAGTYTVSGTEAQRAELKGTTLSGDSLSGGSIANALIDLKEATSVNLSNITLQNSQLEMTASVGQNAIVLDPTVSGAITLTNTTDGADVRVLAADTTVQRMMLGNFSNVQLKGGSLSLTLQGDVTLFENSEWLSVQLDSPTALAGIMMLDANSPVTLSQTEVQLYLAMADGRSGRLTGYMDEQNSNIIFFDLGQMAPEPATTTLSLLALAALAARRRRH